IGVGIIARGSVTLVMVHIIKNIAIESPQTVPHADMIVSSLVLMVLVVNVLVPPVFRKALVKIKK
ncbi:MAG: hypothetical protein KAR51_03450, partial [Candidatus Aenigmarchaeota archaeon]|nr:hypothetical protein [Candidatus Aenigmarchaeota archaeon]